MNMKFLGFMAVLSVVGMADAATSRSSMYQSINMQNADGDTIRINRSAATEESYRDYDRGYAPRHVQRASRAGAYDGIETYRSQRAEQPMTAKDTYVKGKTYKKTMKRKYFIANPFYQPLQGQFGSVTTGEYLEGKYRFANDAGAIDRKLGEWSIKEDLSFGLTDRIALQGMAKYNKDKLTWKDVDTGGTDVYKNKGLNVYGLGLQGRIVDTNDWIATVSGYYEHQKHGVDYFIADLKAGYKVATSTIYGLLRGWAINMEGDYYGDYMADDTTWAMLVYGESKDTLWMGEAGLGVWTVLAEDWTLNLEGLYGAYDWHNQFSIKGAFGWQPNDYFALNLYAKTSLYDSADGKVKNLHKGNLPITAADFMDPNKIFPVKLSKNREWSVGLQVMFQF